jgi:excisionase family DNA binding protein
LPVGFVEDIHVSSNTCKDVKACANTGSVSDEKSQNVQIHASLGRDFAGSLLDGVPPEPEVRPRIQPLLSVRQVAAALGVCAATVYRMCEQGELPHFRVRNVIRVAPMDVKAILQRSRGKHPR